MTIEIQSATLEARIRKQLETTGSNRLEGKEVRAKLQRGLEEFQRGEGIPEEELAQYLRRLKFS